MKIVDNFIWLIVTDKAREIYNSGIFDLYILHEDGSESLVGNLSEIKEGQEVGIEVGTL